MKQNNLSRKEASPCSTKNMPVPESVVCASCGAEAEVWSDETEATCPGCKRLIPKGRLP